MAENAWNNDDEISYFRFTTKDTKARREDFSHGWARILEEGQRGKGAEIRG